MAVHPPRRSVVSVGNRFPNLDPERSVLAQVQADVIDAKDMSRDEVGALMVNADAILLGAQFQLDAPLIQRLERCRCIVRYGVGMDNVDLDAARERAIPALPVTDYGIEEVSNHAIALLMALHRQLPSTDRNVRAGGWSSAGLRIRRLSECTLGLIGLGRIGSEVCRKARAFSMRVVGFDPYLTPEQIAERGAEPVAFDEVLAVSDFVSLHLPLTEQTAGIIGADAFARMKEHAFLINVARGPLIDQSELLRALGSGRLGGAGLDVFDQEPLPSDSPLRRQENTILTPHMAWFSEESRRELQTKAAEVVARYLASDLM